VATGGKETSEEDAEHSEPIHGAALSGNPTTVSLPAIGGGGET
jgi:hypothetical protein